ncbi:MAG: hypothetical protein JSS62_03325 [Verrucomicrobia bacterium]|nr:hypothetical protein [Verrucomicrobiota bacterium]MBS0646701.1 hypothetical protein [Verrucomicrobiota bacterium]
MSATFPIQQQLSVTLKEFFVLFPAMTAVAAAVASIGLASLGHGIGGGELAGYSQDDFLDCYAFFATKLILSIIVVAGCAPAYALTQLHLRDE